MFIKERKNVQSIIPFWCFREVLVVFVKIRFKGRFVMVMVDMICTPKYFFMYFRMFRE